MESLNPNGMLKPGEMGLPRNSWYGARFVHTYELLGICTIKKVQGLHSREVFYSPDATPETGRWLDALREANFHFRVKVGINALTQVVLRHASDSFVEECVKSWVVSPKEAMRRYSRRHRDANVAAEAARLEWGERQRHESPRASYHFPWEYFKKELREMLLEGGRGTATTIGREQYKTELAQLLRDVFEQYDRELREASDREEP